MDIKNKSKSLKIIFSGHSIFVHTNEPFIGKTILIKLVFCVHKLVIGIEETNKEMFYIGGLGINFLSAQIFNLWQQFCILCTQFSSNKLRY